MMTSFTWWALRSPRSKAARIQISPSFAAGISANPPPYVPIAVRTALTITASCNSAIIFFLLVLLVLVRMRASLQPVQNLGPELLPGLRAGQQSDMPGIDNVKLLILATD